MLNTDSPIPLYHQLAERLCEDIQTGEYPVGARIPSEHALAARYGVGRPTVRQATDVLVRRRLIERRRGAGTFVLERTPEVDLFSLAGTLRAFRDSGVEMESEILEPPALTTAPDDPENPFAGAPVLAMTRLSRVDARPVLLEKLYLDASLFSGLERLDLAGRSLSQVVEEKFFLRPLRARQNFRVMAVRGRDARALGLRGPKEVLLVTRLIDFRSQAGAIFAQLYCRTDRLVFSQVIEGTQDG